VVAPLSINFRSQPKELGSTILSGIKTVLQLADGGLKGLGIPGVEGLPSLLLTIISYYEASPRIILPLAPHIDVRSHLASERKR
jgi:hypothetical protein